MVYVRQQNKGRMLKTVVQGKEVFYCPIQLENPDDLSCYFYMLSIDDINRAWTIDVRDADGHALSGDHKDWKHEDLVAFFKAIKDEFHKLKTERILAKKIKNQKDVYYLIHRHPMVKNCLDTFNENASQNRAYYLNKYGKGAKLYDTFRAELNEGLVALPNVI
jgi:hypothetical protein